MRKLPATILIATALSGLSAGAYAQESSPRQYGTLEGQSDSRYEESSVETEPATSKSTKPDSVASTKPVVVKKTTPETAKVAKKSSDDEAPFNFLYYIIQRFKTTDIIED